MPQELLDGRLSPSARATLAPPPDPALSSRPQPLQVPKRLLDGAGEQAVAKETAHELGGAVLQRVVVSVKVHMKQKSFAVAALLVAAPEAPSFSKKDAEISTVNSGNSPLNIEIDRKPTKRTPTW